MPTVLKLRRGTTTQNNAFTGAEGEISIDTQKDTLIVHDGSTAGGHELARTTGTQTLTNKTISGGSNTLSAIANASLTNSSITVSDGSNTSPVALGGTLTIQGTSNEVEVAESSGTYTIGLPDNPTVGGNLTVTGNFTVNGTTTTVSTTNTTATDKLFELANGTSGTPTGDIGIVGERGSSDNIFIGFDESSDEFAVGTGSFTGSTTGDLTYTKGTFASAGTRLYDPSDGSHYVSLVAPSISSNVSFVLPNSTGSSNQVLITDGSGNLSFTSVTNAAGAGLSDLVDDTSPQLGGNLDTNSNNILIDDAHFIADESGNEQIIFQTTGSAVNQLDVTNAATGNAPEISATGDDTNISLKLTPKGTGKVVLDGNVSIDTGVIDLKNGGTASKVLFYCESSNAHAQTVQSAPHSVGATNTLTLPGGTTIGNDAAVLVSDIGTQTLTNKTLTTPTLTTPIANAGIQLKNGSTSAGFLEFFEDSDNGTNKATLIGPASTGDVTLTLPSATDTLVGKATTDTLTNKTTTNLVLNGTATGTAIKDEDNMASDSATHIATQQSIKAYVDTEIGNISSTAISQGNSNVTVADSGTGNVTIEVDGTDRITTVAATTTTATGHSIVLGAGSNSAAGQIKFLEGTDNGTNGVTLIGPASTADVTVTLPAAADTLVGKATTDTLTNKSIDLDANTLSGTLAEFNSALQSESFVSLTGSETLTNKILTTPTLTTPIANAGIQLKNGATSAGFLEFFEDSDNGTNKVTLIGPASTADVTVVLPAAADTLVGKATTDTLTNKSIDLANNTLTGSLAEFNSALQSESFASLTGSETLTNKTLTTPTITTPVINAGAQLKNGATSAGFLEFFEDSDNGTNKVTLIGPASTADITLTLPTQAGTVVVSNTTDGNDVQLDSLGLNTAASGTAGELRASDDITAFYSSDVALKENINNIPNPMDMVSKLNGVLFDWKESFIKSKGGEDGYFVRKKDVGVIAQDVESVLPEIVATRQNGTKAVKYDRLCALLIECVKDLQDQVNNLKK